MKKTKLLILLVAIMLLFATGCTTETTVEEQVQVTESPTPTLEVVEDDITIVSTVPSVTEILFELGCGDQIIGVDAYSNYPEAAIEIEKVGDFNGFDVEKVISLNPSIVFAGNMLQIDQIEQLEDAGVNVLAVEPTYYEDIMTSIIIIGEATNKADEAEQLASKIESHVNETKELTASAEAKPTVYYVMGIGEYGNWTSGKGSFINSIMEFAGGDCVTKDSEVEWLDYPLEDLLIANPDVLVVSDYVNMEELLVDPIYSEISAVKNKRIININPDIIERPGPRLMEAIDVLSAGFVGE